MTARATAAGLLAALDEAAALLSAEGQDSWAERMRTAAAEIRAGDGHGIERILSAYGGMGSFNDLIFRDRRLDALRTSIYHLARELAPRR